MVTASNNSSPSMARVLALLAILVGGIAAVAYSVSTSSETNELTIVNAIILGLVEGFTEYLPVSSTGHLLITNRILGIGETPESLAAIETYAIAIQIGAILAVLLLYRERIVSILSGVIGRDPSGKRLAIAIGAAFAPTAVIGLALKDFVEERLFGPTPIAIAWVVGGIGIIVFAHMGGFTRAGTELTQLSAKNAFFIGCAQAIALWPGTSRSLVTIVGGVLVGLSLKAAVEFSFLLGLVTLGAATALSLTTDGGELVEHFGYLSPTIGLVVAAIAAALSIKFMVDSLKSRGFAVFGYYRVLIGAATIAAIAQGAL